jgi:branched-chain amino acid aminotransferase
VAFNAKSNALSFIDGSWHEGNPPIIGPMTHAAWLGSVVFDGARAFEGVTPDLDRHCERCVQSAEIFGLKAILSAGEICEVALDGIKRFPPGTALYVRPMFFAEEHGGILQPDPESTRFVLTLAEAPMPPATGFSVGLSSYRRPTLESAPTDAKASCLYPNGARALKEVNARGFENAVMLDALGNVAEFATANLFMVRDGVCLTPYPNGTFLNGVTRQRVISLLRNDGVEVIETTIRPHELDQADEIFNTGNYGKVQPVTRYEGRELQPGPVFRRSRELYWDFAHSRL